MARHKNANWIVPERPSWEGAACAVLMDMRDELQDILKLLSCRNALDVPDILRAIEKNTRKRRRATGSKRKAR